MNPRGKWGMEIVVSLGSKKPAGGPPDATGVNGPPEGNGFGPDGVRGVAGGGGEDGGEGWGDFEGDLKGEGEGFCAAFCRRAKGEAPGGRGGAPCPGLGWGGGFGGEGVDLRGGYSLGGGWLAPQRAGGFERPLGFLPLAASVNAAAVEG